MFLRAMAVLMAILSLNMTPSLASPARAQEAEDPVAQALAGAIIPIEQAEDGSLSGAGFDRLVEEGRRSQFVLVGEQHGTREIALAAGALHRALVPAGFDYMVVEIGPWSTRHVENLIRSGEGQAARFIRSPGMELTLPFIFFEEELALVEQAVSLSPRDDHVLWGVDQEFIGSGPILAQALADLAQSDRERAAAATFTSGVSENAMYVGTADQAELDALLEPFGEASAEARSLVEAIVLSNRVYSPFTGRGGSTYSANLERENHMKTNFIAHFAASLGRDSEPPRAFFKFGGNHMQQGHSGTNVPALGNFVFEWGHAFGYDAFNLMIDCDGGEMFSLRQFAGVPCRSYYLSQISPMADAMGDARTALFDLRSLRPMIGRLEGMAPELEDLILSYDYYLVIRDVTPQTPLAQITLPEM